MKALLTGILALACAATAGTAQRPQHIRAADGAAPSAHVATAVDLSQVGPSIVAARKRWMASGLTQAEQGRLQGVSIAFRDLPGAELAETRGATITIDPTAAGWGWFVDSSPLDDAEFAGGAGSGEAAGRMDLLTVLVHEFGHVLGRGDLTADAPHVMASALARGKRHVAPAPEGAMDMLVEGADEVVSGFTLPAGRSVTITFDAMINKPFPAGVGQVSMQASVTATSAATRLSDDPRSLADGDATTLVVQCATPIINSITPTGGIVTGGTAVTITGDCFETGATVTIGGVAATGVVVDSATTIRAVSPARPQGTYDVVVTNPGGPSATLERVFTYGCPFTVTPTLGYFGGAGGNGTVQVTTPVTSCTWTVSSDAGWVGITFGDHAGSKTLNFSIEPNPLSGQRVANLQIAGTTVVIRQAPVTSGVAGDLNGDGMMDLLLQHRTEGALAVWLMNGTTLIDGRRPTPGSVGIDWRIVATGDFNGDGDQDIVFQNTDRSLAVWYMDGTSRLDAQFFNPSRLPEGWSVVAATDLNADGHVDLVLEHTEGFRAAWLLNGITLMDGVPLTPSRVESDWKIVGSGDMNRDGRPDLVWQHTDGTLAAWLMNGTASLDVQFLSPSRPSDSNWRVRGVGDANGDGRPDLLLQHAVSGQLAVWLMNGLTLSDGRLFSPSTVPFGWLLVGPR